MQVKTHPKFKKCKHLGDGAWPLSINATGNMPVGPTAPSRTGVGWLRPCYSKRKAMTGSIFKARRAGK